MTDSHANDSHDNDSLMAEDSARNAAMGESKHDPSPADRVARAPRKVVFDDFQITRAEQEARIEEERRVWNERQQRRAQAIHFWNHRPAPEIVAG